MALAHHQELEEPISSLLSSMEAEVEEVRQAHSSLLEVTVVGPSQPHQSDSSMASTALTEVEVEELQDKEESHQPLEFRVTEAMGMRSSPSVLKRESG